MSSTLATRTRVGAQAALFVTLGVAGGAFGIWRADVDPSMVTLRLSPGVWGLVVIMTLGIFATDAWRYRAVGRGVGLELRWTTSVHASIACHFFSCITPGSSMGAPAAMAMLRRADVDWPTATVVSFGKSMLGSCALFLGAFGFLLTGVGPELGPGIQGLLLWGLGVVSGVLLMLLVLGAFPATARRLGARSKAFCEGRSLSKPVHAVVDGALVAVDRLAQLKPSAIPEIVVSQLSHYGTLVGLMVVLLAAGGAAELPSMWGSSWVYLAFMYVAPTPGAAGLAEGTAGDFFGALLSGADALAVVLLYRFLAFYAFVGVGAVHLAFVGGVDAIRGRPSR